MIRLLRNLGAPPPNGGSESHSTPSSATQSNGCTNGSKRRAASARLRRRNRKRRTLLAMRVLDEARAWLLGLGSLVVFALVYWLAFALRFDFRIPGEWVEVLLATAPWVLAIKLAVFYATGQCHGWWLHVTFSDLKALLRAAVLSLGLVVAVDYFVFPQQIPRAVLLLDCVMTIVLYGAVRGSGRMALEHFRPALRNGACRPALLVGADRSSGLLAHQINCHAGLGYRVCGFLAANGRNGGKQLGQIPVVGHVREVRDVAGLHGVEDVLVIAGTLPGQRMRWLMSACDEAELTLKIIPPVEDLFNGDRRIPLRDLEIGDLLRRDPVELNCRAIGDLVRSRRILITGAGGSIGSEICRQVLRFEPAELVLLGRGENRIFTIDCELRALRTTTRLCPVIGDITDEGRMRRVFGQYRPEVVFHAAAHKHVPLMEANVGEAVKNNVLGTKCVADLADEYDAKAFVLISSDKAVNPSSVMGATKHLAERYVQALSSHSGTRFEVVRFGNVLGSAGSVVPLFQDQIRRGGPITVTDPRMTRYFMTIPEAAQLVLQATAMGRGGEIYYLDMGEPVRIVDLARDLVRLSGLPADAIDITYTGIRSGEKLVEELHFHEERTLRTEHPKIHLAEHRPCDVDEVARCVALLENAVGESEEVARAALCDAVPEYQPPSHGRAGQGASAVSRK